MLIKLKSKSLILILLYPSIILCFTSCERQIIIPNEISITSVEPSIKIPLNAGLYLSQGFRGAKYPVILYGKYFTQTVFVGDTFYNSSKKIMENIFQSTAILDPIESIPDLSSKKYDVIIAPEVVNLVYSTEKGELSGLDTYCFVQTTIKWMIASPEGKDVYATTIKSDGVKIKLKKFKDNEECIKRSIKSNFERAQEDIYSSGWWKKQWWKNSN